MDSNTKGCRVPGTQKNLCSDEEGQKPLDEVRAGTYASCVMRLMYLAQDRHDIVYTVKNLSRKVIRPSEAHIAALIAPDFEPYRSTVMVLAAASSGTPIPTDAFLAYTCVLGVRRAMAISPQARHFLRASLEGSVAGTPLKLGSSG